MSTRCQFAVYETEDQKVEGAKVFIYRHSDGYPEGVVPDVLPFLKAFNESRGISDTSYCAARLVARLASVHCGEKTNENDTLGLGIDAVLHEDIEFFYHISPTALRVLKVTYNAKEYRPNESTKWTEVKRYSLEKAVA